LASGRFIHGIPSSTEMPDYWPWFENPQIIPENKMREYLVREYRKGWELTGA
jgi:hypothetical protein